MKKTQLIRVNLVEYVFSFIQTLCIFGDQSSVKIIDRNACILFLWSSMNHLYFLFTQKYLAFDLNVRKKNEKMLHTEMVAFSVEIEYMLVRAHVDEWKEECREQGK